ncbi:MAG: enoyl-CoA hydratase/isomerase family protein [Chloroflexi bacterium]|nr:enoyl-CoA hydratase/isomerase family protein [Chloroflexota bacterium]MBP8056221.1 enoyl-CoA hydratase/isomerase family protein [Chloroflexota bacterium]
MALILTEFREQVAVVTLNRPERHNSLVAALLEELLAGLAEVARSETCRVMVLTARGRNFSTGGDVRAFYEHQANLESYAHHLVGLLNQTILALLEMPMPVIAAAPGIITGGSLGLLLASDITFITPETTITPYYNVVGFSPDGGWTAILPQIIGARRVADILLRNLSITAEQAVAWGLAGQVVAREKLMDVALAAADTLIHHQPGSMRHTRQLLRGNLPTIAARLEAERAHFVQQILTPEALAGMKRFLGE